MAGQGMYSMVKMVTNTFTMALSFTCSTLVQKDMIGKKLLMENV